jgi:hypothetical protein
VRAALHGQTRALQRGRDLESVALGAGGVEVDECSEKRRCAVLCIVGMSREVGRKIVTLDVLENRDGPLVALLKGLHTTNRSMMELSQDNCFSPERFPLRGLSSLLDDAKIPHTDRSERIAG